MREALEAAKESPTTVPGGLALQSGRVAAGCRRAPENRNDRCAQEDRDPERRQERREEDDDYAREDDAHGREEDEPGTEPDGA